LDFNPGSLDIIGVLLIFPACLANLFYIYVSYVSRGVYASAGPVAVIVVLFIILTQLFISFLYFDATFQPLRRERRRKYERYSALSRSNR